MCDDISHIVVGAGLLQAPTIKTRENRMNNFSKENHLAVEATLEEILSIPCTVLYPDVYDVMQTSIDVLKQEEDRLDEKLKTDSDRKPKQIKIEPKEITKTNQSQTQDDLQIKTERSSSEIKSEMVNGDVENTSNVPQSVKTEPIPSPTECSTKEAPTSKLHNSENEQHETEVIKNKILVNGDATLDEKKKQSLLENSLMEVDIKSDVICKKESDNSNQPKIEDSETQVSCQVETKSNFAQNINGTVMEVSSPLEEDANQLEIKEEFHSKSPVDSNPVVANKTLTDKKPNLVDRIKVFLEKRNVLLLEDEAYGRDGSVFDPLSGPLFCCKSFFSKNDLSSRLGSISNILRSLSFIPTNHAEFCRHYGLMRSLSGMLLLRHKHKIKKKRKLDFENVEEMKEKIKDIKSWNNFYHNKDEDHLENNKCRFVGDKVETSEKNLHSTLDGARLKRSVSSELFAPKEESNCEPTTGVKVDKCFFSAIVLEEDDDVYADPWWWDSVQRVREDALVILSNISSALDLSLMPDDRISLSIIDACLHFALCPSSDACDAYSSKPR